MVESPQTKRAPVGVLGGPPPGALTVTSTTEKESEVKAVAQHTCPQCHAPDDPQPLPVDGRVVAYVCAEGHLWQVGYVAGQCCWTLLRPGDYCGECGAYNPGPVA